MYSVNKTTRLVGQGGREFQRRIVFLEEEMKEVREGGREKKEGEKEEGGRRGRKVGRKERGKKGGRLGVSVS